MSKLSRVVAAVYDKPWFIRPDYLATIDEIVRLHVGGGRLSQDEIHDRLVAAGAAAGPRRGSGTAGSVRVIPIYGPIFPRANLMTEFSGGATISSIRAQFRDAMDDDAVGSILFDVDSPGGYTDGVEELSAEIRAARGRKPMVASANYLIASAALYVVSGVDEITASPSSEVGWVGTVLVHQEFSKMDEMDGVTTTIVRNPPGKYGGNPYEPLSDQALAEFTQLVDERSGEFERAMSKGRGVPISKVRSDFGQGGGMSAARAKAAGLVDRVETFDDTYLRLATGKGPAARGTTAIAAIEDVPDALPTDKPVVEPGPNEGGDEEPANDPDADATGEAGTPPDADRSTEAQAALALARARAR
jgi:ClpP class serine protease